MHLAHKELLHFLPCGFAHLSLVQGCAVCHRLDCDNSWRYRDESRQIGNMLLTLDWYTVLPPEIQGHSGQGTVEQKSDLLLTLSGALTRLTHYIKPFCMLHTEAAISFFYKMCLSLIKHG